MPLARVGISGWRYAGWRGDFYPKGLPQRLELSYAAERMNSVEVNGSFYSLQRRSSWEAWREAVPDDFVFSVKGGRYITHMLRLRNPEQALTRFFGQGVLELGARLGPILWQLPERVGFDPDLLDAFLSALPRENGGRPLRHAFEVRAGDFDDPRFFALLERHGVACVLADTAGRWPALDRVTADFVYLRLHGDTELYASGYSPQALDRWAERVRDRLAEGLDAYVYFDNDMKVHAPYDAMALAERLRAAG